MAIEKSAMPLSHWFKPILHGLGVTALTIGHLIIRRDLDCLGKIGDGLLKFTTRSIGRSSIGVCPRIFRGRFDRFGKFGDSRVVLLLLCQLDAASGMVAAALGFGQARRNEDAG